MRKAFIKALCEIAKKDERVVLLTGDLGFNVLEPFKEHFPDRFFNIGVAEANLVTVAAGLATAGYIPLTYSIATFMSMRPFEQIRNMVSLQNLNVKIIAVGAGISYTKAGPTHHAIEDISLMRSLPNMTIIAPSDQKETYQATKAMLAYSGPVYFRIGRNPADSIVIPESTFIIGRARLLQKGEKIALLATGNQVEIAFQVAKILKQLNIQASIYSFPTVKPLDKQTLSEIYSSHVVIATLEDHSITGGFGSAICEDVYEEPLAVYPSIVRFGFKPGYSKLSASYSKMIEEYSFSPYQIAERILQIMMKQFSLQNNSL